jgi:pyruvate-formate lyase-activating enzyme
VLAREQGLKNSFVSNGFISEAPLRQIAPLLDAINVDLKFFREESYRRISRARMQPVLDAIRLYHELGVWVEVTTLVIPDLNDSDEELTGIAEFICDLDPAIPWHLSQYYPTSHSPYKSILFMVKRSGPRAKRSSRSHQSILLAWTRPSRAYSHGLDLHQRFWMGTHGVSRTSRMGCPLSGIGSASLGK